MLAFDTNILVYAAHVRFKEYPTAQAFLNSLSNREDVVVCELVLVEVYLKIRSPGIFERPYSAIEAVNYCNQFRTNEAWSFIENAPVMDDVWKHAAQRDFAFRRIIDARLALTLRHHRVNEFATANTKDFEGFGFSRIWNPLLA
jgi:toxin-antitoxin system PIN domain toxin